MRAFAEHVGRDPIDVIPKAGRYGAYVLVGVLTVAGLLQYKGDPKIYLLFSIASNLLLYMGFRRNAIFFDAFIGVFFWLGFWLKLTVRVGFMGGQFQEAVGLFDGSGSAFDRGLLVSSCGLSGLILASVVREKFIFNYREREVRYVHGETLRFYQQYRGPVLTAFAVLFVAVAVTNIYWGVYQRGEITRTVLPLGLNGIYKWLLLFGLASVSATILQCELRLRDHPSLLSVLLSLFESFSSNISLLSRGMILNSFALAYGVYVASKNYTKKLGWRLVVAFFLVFAVLMESSVYAVNYLRAGMDPEEGVGVNRSLMLDRWVGIEGVMSVASSPKAGWGLWRDAWRERYSENDMSFYDKTLIVSSYRNTDFTKKHPVSLPGILAFLFYPGSYYFLIAGTLLAGLVAASIEVLAFRLSGQNLILCSLIAEVVAFRYANFGYVPAQSYLLLGSIVLNLGIIYVLNRFLGLWCGERS